MIEDLEKSRATGSLADATLATADARIEALLSHAPTHAPRLLDAQLLAKHASLAPLHAGRGAVGQTVSLEEG